MGTIGIRTGSKALLMAACALAGHAQCGNSFVKAIVEEQNRYRTEPKAVAAELEAMKGALLESRTVGVRNPDKAATARAAIATAIADLSALKPLPPLRCDNGASAAAGEAARTMNGQHSSMDAIREEWRANRAGGRVFAESVVGPMTDEGSDAETARRIVRDLFCDWGEANAEHYSHRMFILSYHSPTVMARDPAWLTPRLKTSQFSIVGAGTNGTWIYIQYGM